MPRKANPMVGTQLLVSPDIRDRARALAVVIRCSVADVWREAIDRTLEAMESDNRPALGDLDADLRLLVGADAISDALETMIKKNLNAEDLKNMEDFPW